MKLFSLLLSVGFLAISTVQSWAADKVTLQLKWVTQAQFAGYYVARDKGFYKEENLDVEIKPGGPDIAPAQVLAGGGADVILDWMPSSAGDSRKRTAHRQYCPAVQILGYDAHLPQRIPELNPRQISRVKLSAYGFSETNIRFYPG